MLEYMRMDTPIVQLRMMREIKGGRRRDRVRTYMKFEPI